MVEEKSLMTKKSRSRRLWRQAGGVTRSSMLFTATSKDANDTSTPLSPHAAQATQATQAMQATQATQAAQATPLMAGQPATQTPLSMGQPATQTPTIGQMGANTGLTNSGNEAEQALLRTSPKITLSGCEGAA